MSRHIGVAEPWEIVCMDFVGPISPASVEGHSYILVNVDYLTRFRAREKLSSTPSVAQ